MSTENEGLIQRLSELDNMREKLQDDKNDEKLANVDEEIQQINQFVSKRQS